MGGVLIILGVTILIGVILWTWERVWGNKPLHHHANSAVVNNQIEENNENANTIGICCGLHIICEKTGQVNEPPMYYDDEELDRFSGREAEDYSDEEIEEFRDVLLTLHIADSPGWAVSLERRRITLPAELKPELELMLSEAQVSTSTKREKKDPIQYGFDGV